MPCNSSDNIELKHEIFVLDAYLEDTLDEAQSHEQAQRFIDKTLDVLNMEKLGGLLFNEAEDLSAPGWSFIQMITTSHISCHYFEKPGRRPHIRIDFYSCKSVDWEKVIKMAHEEFNFEKWHATFVQRNTYCDEKDRVILDIHGEGGEALHVKNVLESSVQTVVQDIMDEHVEEASKTPIYAR